MDSRGFGLLSGVSRLLTHILIGVENKQILVTVMGLLDC